VVNLLLLLCLFSREVTGCSWGSSKPDPVDCKWSSSSPWSSCSATCGRGTRSKRIKYDRQKHGGAPCDFPAGQKLQVDGSGKASLREDCNVKKCPGSGSGPGATTEMEWTQWSAWSSCSRTCGGGERTRERNCKSIGGSLSIKPRTQLRIVNRHCRGEGTEESSCGNNQCPGPEPDGTSTEPSAPSEPNGPSKTCTSSCAPKGCITEKSVDYNGADIANPKIIGSQQGCANYCASTECCCFWTWNKQKNCFIKSSKGDRRENSGAVLVSGNRGCGTKTSEGATLFKWFVG